MNKILVAGAGAMGTIIGALLTKHLSSHAYQIDLLDTNSSHIDALNDKGAKITGHLDTTIKVNGITPDQLLGQYDLVISTVKQMALRASLNHLLPFLHDDSLVLTLQNGIPEDVAAEVIGKHRVIGGGIEFSGTFVGAGVVKLASPQDTLGFTIGEVSGEITERLSKVKNILETSINCELTTVLRETRFTKLTDNTVASAIPTALGCILGKVLENDQASACIAELGRECSMVLQGLNIEPLELFGFQPIPENIYFDDKQKREQVITYWRKTYLRYHQQTASMLQDIQHGRLCEIDFINGKMLQEADQLGIDMPMNRAVIKAIKTLQSGGLPLENAWNQLDELSSNCLFS